MITGRIGTWLLRKSGQTLRLDHSAAELTVWRKTFETGRTVVERIAGRRTLRWWKRVKNINLILKENRTVFSDEIHALKKKLFYFHRPLQTFFTSTLFAQFLKFCTLFSFHSNLSWLFKTYLQRTAFQISRQPYWNGCPVLICCTQACWVSLR